MKLASRVNMANSKAIDNMTRTACLTKIELESISQDYRMEQKFQQYNEDVYGRKNVNLETRKGENVTLQN